MNESLTSSLFYFFLMLFYIGVELIDRVVIVLGGRKWDSTIHTHVSILPQTLLPFRLSYNIGQSSMCYTRTLLVIYFKYSSVYMSIPNSLTIPSPFFPLGNHTFVLYWLQILVVANGRESSETDISDIRRLIPFFFWLCHMSACTILVPQPGFEPKSMTVKAQVLTTGLPGNVLFHFWIWPMKSIKISDNWTFFKSLLSPPFLRGCLCTWWIIPCDIEDFTFVTSKVPSSFFCWVAHSCSVSFIIKTVLCPLCSLCTLVCTFYIIFTELFLIL